jgi:hypothetical protein
MTSDVPERGAARDAALAELLGWTFFPRVVGSGEWSVWRNAAGEITAYDGELPEWSTDDHAALDLLMALPEGWSWDVCRGNAPGSPFAASVWHAGKGISSYTPKSDDDGPPLYYDFADAVSAAAYRALMAERGAQ